MLNQPDYNQELKLNFSLFNKKESITSIGYNFNKVKNYFNALNQDKTHFTNSNDICTSMECVKEMVDKIPNIFWKNPNIKVFDSCCGNGNFHAYISQKTELKNLYFNEINIQRIKNLMSYFGQNINLTQQDFLTYNEDEQFDLVVSNPPYAKFSNEKRASKNHNLSRLFIEKALKIVTPNGYLLFIVPNNWMSFSDRNILPKLLTQYQFIHININGAKKWFPKVGSSFTWFLLQKKPNKLAFTVENNYKIKDCQTVKIKPKSNFIPLYLNEITLNMIDKVVNSKFEKYPIETTSDLHRTTKKDFIKNEKNSNFKYKLIHTPTQTVWSKRPHKFQKGYKVFLSLTNQYSIFIDNCGVTQSVAFIRCKSLKEAKKIKIELEHPVYKFINNITRYGNFNNIRILQSLTKLEHLNLNQIETDFISKFNRAYYGKKEKEHKYFRIQYIDSFPLSKRAEKIILESLDKKPIGCTQR